jgi:hypothetical protein
MERGWAFIHILWGCCLRLLMFLILLEGYISRMTKSGLLPLLAVLGFALPVGVVRFNRNDVETIWSWIAERRC